MDSRRSRDSLIRRRTASVDGGGTAVDEVVRHAKVCDGTATPRSRRNIRLRNELRSMGKKLIDTDHPAWKTLVAVRGKIVSTWKDASLPFPENGVRLIRRSDATRFTHQIETLRAELRDAERELNTHYDELRAKAQRRLGSLYNADDYQLSIHYFDAQNSSGRCLDHLLMNFTLKVFRSNLISYLMSVVYTSEPRFFTQCYQDFHGHLVVICYLNLSPTDEPLRWGKDYSELFLESWLQFIEQIFNHLFGHRTSPSRRYALQSRAFFGSRTLQPT
ncbi:MAG: hypothetical protein ACRC46_11340 [Thermoguttaceae bacterium]